MLRVCVRCKRFAYAGDLYRHACPAPGVAPLAEDTDLLDYLTKEGNGGISKDEILALSARCSECDRLFSRLTGGAHVCPIRDQNLRTILV